MKVLDKWNALSKKERTQVWILTVCMLISCYMIVAVTMFDKMFTVEKLANRKQNRIEVRIGDFEIPEIEPGLTQKALDKTLGSLAERERRLRVYKDKLLPMDSPKPRELVKLKITHMAIKHDINILQLDTDGTDIRLMPEELTGDALKNYFENRTAFSIKAQGSYFDFIRFIEDFSTLPYLNFIQELTLSPISIGGSAEGQSEETSAQDQGLLDISFKLQM